MKLDTLEKTRPTIRFQGELRAAVGGGSLLILPRETGADLPSFESTMVEGTIDGFPFRAPLQSDGLRISNALQDAAGANAGDTVTVEITRVDEEPEIRVPVDLSEALAAAPVAQALFEEVTPMARREWIRWVASAKQEETRARRIEVGIDKLRKGMRRPCCFPGVNFVTKDLVTPEETWIPLPNAKKGAG